MSNPYYPAASALGDSSWTSQLADRVLETFPNETIYTCAAGISPSGVVHFGNFRDVITAFGVASELKARSKQVRMLFSWDEFDRFRKVPADIDPAYAQYLGMPLTAVPDPFGKAESYARHYEMEFEHSMREMGITLDYRYQTKKYQAGDYADQVALAMQKRLQIADILLSFKTEKGNLAKGIEPEEFRAAYYPVTVYSRFTGTDKTEVTAYDGGTVLTYLCVKTGQSETIDFRETPIVKLQWKVDWAMRWGYERVHFEPGGKDHASPGGSYDVSSVLAREIFDAAAPVFQGYEFVGIQGMDGKMSGSKGNAVSPATLLEIYEPALLKWLYLKRSPTQGFNLAFDTEIYRQYDEFDRATAALRKGEPNGAKILQFSGIDSAATAESIPFKQTVALGQITQWNAQKLTELLHKMETSYDPASIERRLAKARAWLERYNPDEIIALRDTPNAAYYASLTQATRAQVQKLRDYLAQNPASVAELEETVYAIPKNPVLADKDMKVAQRSFFKDIYMLLIGKETGPRLSTFLWAVDRKKTLDLLDFAE